MLIKLSSSIRDYYGLVAMATEQNSTVLVRPMAMVVEPLILSSRRGRVTGLWLRLQPLVLLPCSPAPNDLGRRYIEAGRLTEWRTP
jgi:hypothetical protein